MGPHKNGPVAAVHEYGFNIVRLKFFTTGVPQLIDCKPAAFLVETIESTAVGTYPDKALIVFCKTAHHIVIQRVGHRFAFNDVETVHSWMPVVDASEICPEPHSSLIVPKDAAYRRLAETAVQERVALDFLKNSVLQDAQSIVGTHP